MGQPRLAPHRVTPRLDQRPLPEVVGPTAQPPTATWASANVEGAGDDRGRTPPASTPLPEGHLELEMDQSTVATATTLGAAADDADDDDDTDDTTDGFDVVVIGSGPAALALLARLREPEPAALYTEEERNHLHWLRLQRRQRASPRRQSQPSPRGGGGVPAASEAHSHVGAELQPAQPVGTRTRPAVLRTRKPSSGSQRVLHGALREVPAHGGAAASHTPGTAATTVPCSRRRRLRVLVVDKLGAGWLGQWHALFGALRIPHLRSPLFFHPEPSSLDSLLAFAHRQARDARVDADAVWRRAWLVAHAVSATDGGSVGGGGSAGKRCGEGTTKTTTEDGAADSVLPAAARGRKGTPAAARRRLSRLARRHAGRVGSVDTREDAQEGKTEQGGEDEEGDEMGGELIEIPGVVGREVSKHRAKAKRRTRRRHAGDKSSLDALEAKAEDAQDRDEEAASSGRGAAPKRSTRLEALQGVGTAVNERVRDDYFAPATRLFADFVRSCVVERYRLDGTSAMGQETAEGKSWPLASQVLQRGPSDEARQGADLRARTNTTLYAGVEVTTCRGEVVDMSWNDSGLDGGNRGHPPASNFRLVLSDGTAVKSRAVVSAVGAGGVPSLPQALTRNAETVTTTRCEQTACDPSTDALGASAAAVEGTGSGLVARIATSPQVESSALTTSPSERCPAGKDGAASASQPPRSWGPGWAHSSAMALPNFNFPPAWLQARLHAEKASKCNINPKDGTAAFHGSASHLVVLGGGLTSAQLVHVGLRLGFSRVTLLLRGAHLRVRPFDVGVEWMGRYANAHRMAFWQCDDAAERLAMLREARGGGSVTPPYARMLRAWEQAGRVVVKTACEVVEATWDETDPRPDEEQSCVPERAKTADRAGARAGASRKERAGRWRLLVRQGGSGANASIQGRPGTIDQSTETRPKPQDTCQSADARPTSPPPSPPSTERCEESEHSEATGPESPDESKEAALAHSARVTALDAQPTPPTSDRGEGSSEEDGATRQARPGESMDARSDSVLEELRADYVLAATGARLGFDDLPFARRVARSHPIRHEGGLPVLTEHLQWGHDVPLFCVGAYSAMQIGPGAFNLGGMREAADRVAARLEDLFQLQDDTDDAGDDGEARQDEAPTSDSTRRGHQALDHDGRRRAGAWGGAAGAAARLPQRAPGSSATHFGFEALGEEDE